MIPRSSYRNIPSVENLVLGVLPARPPVAPRIITDISITVPLEQRSSYYDPRIIRLAAISPKGTAYATLDAGGTVCFYRLAENGLYQGRKIGNTSYSDSQFLTKWGRVHLSVTDAPNGYVAISCLPDEEKIIREHQGETNTPSSSGWFSNKSWHELDNKPSSRSKSKTIEILSAADKHWKPPESLAYLEGRATFLHDSSRLIMLSQRMIYIYSTSTWSLLWRLNTSLLEIPAVDNDFDYCNVRCLQKGYLGLYVATDRFIVWSIETRDLVMQFRHGFTLFERRHCDNYFSMNGELLALFNPKESMLKVFTVENGLCIVTRKIEKDIDLVDFLDSGELVLFQDMWVDFYDPYTGRKSRTKGFKCDYTPGETIFFPGGLLFNNSSGGDPKVSSVIPILSSKTIDGATVRLTHQPIVSDDGTIRVHKLKNDTIFVNAPGFEGQINILSGEETHVRFISPMRFLIVYGRFMEVWLITNEERKSLKLQWAWYPQRILDEGDPLAYQNIIKEAMVSTDTQKVHAKVEYKQGGDPDEGEVTIQLPITDEPYSLDILQDACKNIPLFEKEDFDHIAQIKAIIWHCISKYPYAFNRIRPSYFPINDLMAINRPFADQYITEILKHKKWVPLTNQDGKNALMIALDHQKPTMISLLVHYCITKAKEEDCEYMKMVVDCLPMLCKQFPDLVAKVAKELVYYKCNPDGSTPRFFSTKPPRPGTTGRSANRNFEAYNINTSLRSDKTIIQKAMHLVLWQFPEWIGQSAERILKRTPHSIVTCIVALPGLSQYPAEIDKSNSRHSMDNLIATFEKWFRPRSVFSEVVIQMELFKEAKLMYPIIFFKWKTYARTMFLIMSFLYLIFFGLFIAATALIPNNPSILSWAIIVMASSFLIQELRQIIGLGRYYWLSPYNYIELGSFSMPMLWSLFNLGFIPSENTPEWLAPVGILSLWILILLQMRIISQRLGIFLAIIIEIFKRIVPFLFVFTIILFAFSHSLWLLLRSAPQQPSGSFAGSLVFQNKTVTSQIKLDSILGGNPFGTFMYSLYAVFFFLEQDYSPLDTFDVLDNVPLVIIKVLFTFSTTIILLNVLIAILNSTFSTTQDLGERVWLREMATWIAECEVFLMFPWQRKNAEFFPRYIFYEAYTEKVSEWGESITYHRADYATRHDVKEVKSNMDTHIAVIRDEIDLSQQKIASDISDIRMALNETKDLLEGQLMDLKLLMQEIQGEVVTVETVSDVLEEPQFATENPRLSVAERFDVAEEDPMDVGGPRDTDLWS